MIIDAHTHIFPDNQAAVILQNTVRKFHVQTYGKATASDILLQMDENDITYAVIHMVAPTPSAVLDINTWLINLKQDRLIKFGTLHPHFINYREEIRRLKDNNIRGIKFQPDIQAFTPDDRVLTYPIYEELSRYNLTVMFHVGGEPLPSPHNRSRPDMIRKIAKDFPELRIIAAHLGGLNMWGQVSEHLVGLQNVYMETSLSYKFINPEIGRKIIQNHGHERIFFGTDYPFAPIKGSLEIAKATPFLSETEKADILGHNAYKFFLNN